MSLSFNSFLQAQQRISPYLKPTALMRSPALEQTLKLQGSLFFKMEQQQPTGSFKVRGAFNTLLQLPEKVDKVVAFSSGNFAQAVAFGASKLNKKVTIVMPENAPRKKIEGTRKLGAQIVFCQGKHENGDALVQEIVDKEGYYPLHPFNDYRTIAGQGTTALEVLQTHPEPAHFFSPVGGGGLLSGCGSVCKMLSPKTRVFAVEPVGGNDFYQSFHSHQHCAIEKADTIADGLRAVSVGALNYPILMKTVDEALAVEDEKIIEAMQLLWKEHGLMIEPSGATALAGFLSVHQKLQGDVVILLTGQNVDQEQFTKWMNYES